MAMTAPSSQIRTDLFAEWIDDPVRFCQDVFDMEPREWQPQFLDTVAKSTKRRIAMKACRDAGKTAAAAYLSWWWLCTRPYSLVVTTANTWKQVEQSLWVEIRKLWWRSALPQIFPKWELLQVGVKTPYPEWRAFGLSSDHPENFEGFHGRSVLVVYDEAKRVDRLVYESVQGLLTDGEWREVAISTPGLTSGWFYSAFTDDSELWDLRSINAFEIPRLEPWAADMRYRLGDSNALYRQYVLAEFSPAETGALFPFSILDPAFDTVAFPLPQQNGAKWRKVLGIDPAGTGLDEFAVAFRKGPIVEKIEAWKGWDEMQSVGEVAKMVNDWKPDLLVVEKPGLGGPIISALREYLPSQKIEEFNPGARAYAAEEYDNVKTEIAFGLRQRIAEGEVRFASNDGRLKGQLASFSVGRSPRGLTRLKDPENSGSPDRADAVICAFAADFIRPAVQAGRVDWL